MQTFIPFGVKWLSFIKCTTYQSTANNNNVVSFRREWANGERIKQLANRFNRIEIKQLICFFVESNEFHFNKEYKQTNQTINKSIAYCWFIDALILKWCIFKLNIWIYTNETKAIIRNAIHWIGIIFNLNVIAKRMKIQIDISKQIKTSQFSRRLTIKCEFRATDLIEERLISKRGMHPQYFMSNTSFRGFQSFFVWW